MKFYDCATAPSPRRVRMFIAEKGLEVPTVEINLRDGEQFNEAFRKLNPDCTVPVLELDDGRTLTEIFAICQYLEEIHPEPRLLGNDAQERAIVTMWNSKVEQHGLAAIAEAFRNRAKGFADRALTGPAQFAQIPELAARGRTRAEMFFDRLDARLESNDYLAGGSFTIADISAFVAIEFAGWMKLEIGERANLQRWYELISARPSSKV